MGAQDFSVIVSGKTAKDAFQTARDQALYDLGHRGYTGSIAEKDNFTMIDVPEGVRTRAIGEHPEFNKSEIMTLAAQRYAESLIDSADPRIWDKWGPAGCIEIEQGRYLFFGFAAS